MARLAAVVHPQVYTLDDRLQLIAQRIDASMHKPQEYHGKQFMLRDLASSIVRGTPQHGQSSEDAVVAAVFWFVKNNLEYRQDPRDYDLYMSVGRALEAGSADCDDHTIANAAMMSSLGFLTGAKVVSPDGSNWHIYAVAGVHPFNAPRELIAMDTTQPGSYPGWEPPEEMRQHEYICTFRGGRAVHLTKIRG